MRKYIIEFLKLHKAYYAFSILFSVLSAACTVLPYIISAKIIGLLIAGNKNIHDYKGYIIYLFIVLTCSNLFHKISTGLSHTATFDLLATIRKRLADKLTQIPLGLIDDYSSGKLKDIMVEKVDKVEITFSHIIPEVTGNILVSIITLVYLFCLNWKLALLGLILIPISIGLYLLGMRNMQERFDNYMKKNAILNNTIVEYIHGIEVIKAFNQSGKQYQRLTVAVNEAAHSAIDWMRENVTGMAIAFTLLPSTILVVLPAGSLMYLNGSLAFNDFILIMLLNFALFLPLLQAAGHMDNIAVAGKVLESITTILEEDDLIRPEKSEVQVQHYDVEFKNVSFAYKEENVLEDVSLSIKEHSVNALVGPSGSGKSTITKLLTSFYEAGSGSIEIGGVDIKRLSLEDLNKMIAYVSQKDYLFNMSILENLKMGDRTKSDEEIKEICKRCGVHDFITSLENGYHTMVGSKGLSLSGGERQRICIARAMIKDAPIVVFDEATAYSDPENEELIQRSVSELIKNKTLIVVAHRLSTIVNSDQIILINNKHVEDAGTHDELMSRSELYRNMYNAHMEYKDEVVS
ncbi:MAG: ABC transporter ATP-binding protein [Eubacteriales bacterium]|nr:ABC transporter ATP-binding protein [Eubacteriales bacterium]